MLRKIRITLAAAFFLSITALLIDVSGIVHVWLGWTAKVQFLPALLAMNVGAVAVLAVLTLLFGRVYCSVICPLGVMQDIASHANGQRRKKKYRFSYSPERRWLRYGTLFAFAIAMLTGIASLVALLEPYSIYGRIATNLFAPLYRWGNNLLAALSAHFGSYAFYETEVWIKGLPTLVVAALSFIIICVLAWRGGRTYCNTICPVGTVLGLLSRYALMRPVIDTKKCNACGLCARGCKASCINPEKHTIDYSRCVACMDCIDTCRHGAIRYKISRKKETTGKPATEGQVDTARRRFLSATALLAATSVVKAQQKKVDGGLAVIADKEQPHRATPILPPGAASAEHFARHCTACQLCVSACPNDVLRPSADLLTLMQPQMSYERGYCRPECTRCSEVCPAGAIKPISAGEKAATRIGHAVRVKKNCLPLADGVSCGNCARHCPTGAIQMVPSEAGSTDAPLIPVVNAEKCIGCGACEHLCPARPFSAIYVEGHERHSQY